jgi:RNA polymerase sigma factor (sigma-70 family)
VRAQAARQDVTAFASAYERHHEALYRYCRSMLRDEEDARDALQSTMAKALAALRDEERDFELRPWLFRIAHNEAVSRLRQRRPTVDLEAARALGADSLPQAVEDRERMALLRSDLRDLPDRQRAALVLRELCGLGHEEIAAVLDTTPRGAKQTIYEARVALQECHEGRAMVCGEVQRALSDGDGRVLRGRRMRAHVRSCRACRQFKATLVERPRDLAILMPGLPGGAGGGLLARLLAGLQTSGAGDALVSVSGKAAAIATATVTAVGTTALVHSAHHARHSARPAAAAPVTGTRPVAATAPLAVPSVSVPIALRVPVARPSGSRPSVPGTPNPHAAAPYAGKAHGATPPGHAKKAGKAVPPGHAKKDGAPAMPHAAKTHAAKAHAANPHAAKPKRADPRGQAKKAVAPSKPHRTTSPAAAARRQAARKTAAPKPSPPAAPPGQAKKAVPPEAAPAAAPQLDGTAHGQAKK